MNEFYNQLILSDREYECNFFPQVPNYKKQGVAYILTEGVNDDIVVDDRTSSKQIRRGKYRHLVEISTNPYLKEIRFKSASKERSYTFDIYVKAVIQVKNPIVFYNNKNLDVDAYFTNMFTLDVRKITRKYSILEYDGMDEELTNKLSSYNTMDESTGFEYRISVVDAEPGVEAIEYVKRNDKQNLDAEIKKQARDLVKGVTTDYENAVWTEVIEGKITEREAIFEINRFRNADYEERLNKVDDLRGRRLISEEDARKMIKKIQIVDHQENLIETGQNGATDTDAQADNVLDELYEEE
ncbi:MAG: hypothetical protein NC416_03275 [Eubacterium sp.]|nr:hypothetical protein [Eubacterium sp.]